MKYRFCLEYSYLIGIKLVIYSSGKPLTRIPLEQYKKDSILDRISEMDLPYSLKNEELEEVIVLLKENLPKARWDFLIKTVPIVTTYVRKNKIDRLGI